MKLSLSLLLLSLTGGLFAQTRESYDIISYTVPAGWKKETKESGISYSTENEKERTFCAIAIFKSLPGSTDSQKNFDAAWEAVVKEMVTVSLAPAMQPGAGENGWKAISGYAPFESDSTKGIVLLVTTTGYEKMSNIVILFNSENYQKEIEGFLASVEMKMIPASQNNKADNSKIKSSSGIQKSITTFNDGWTAKALEDYVLVTKESTKYYIHYGIPVPEKQRGFDESRTTRIYWDKLVSPRYTITNLWLNPDVASIATFNYYAEGTGIDKNSGETVFIGFRIILENGVAFCVEATAPDKEEYLRHFPGLNTLKDMRGSNRFAVTKEDIAGNWSSYGSSTLQYYNVYTGENAGMGFSQGGQDFSFKTDNTYTARISGAMGTMGGSQVAFDNKYSGQIKVNDWEITLTKYSGVATVFTCYFEAVKGGRILHIAKKLAPGVHYALVKMK
jgi:hypothetical protein